MARTAVGAGGGPGPGASLARRFVAEGCRVGLFARSADYLDGLSVTSGADALAVLTAVTEPDAYRLLVERARSAWTLELGLRPHVEVFRP